MTLNEYRGIRGFVTHVLPLVRAAGSVPFSRNILGFTDVVWRRHGRSPLVLRDWAAGEQRQRCPWCFMLVEEKRLLWHSRCRSYYNAGQGLGMAPRTSWPPVCARCGFKSWTHFEFEEDHTIALALAWRLGPIIHARALLPMNMQWLCISCHKTKTAEDRAAMAYHDAMSDPNRSPPPQSLMRSMFPREVDATKGALSQ